MLVQLRDVREERATQLTRDVAGRDLQEQATLAHRLEIILPLARVAIQTTVRREIP